MKNASLAVSVVIAAKNEQAHIEEALRSVLNQKGVEFELIFVDDNSDDSTYTIACRLGTEFDRLKIHRNPKNGKCSAFNYGVAMASGQFVCIFAGDDVMPEGSLRNRWESVRHLNPEVPGVGLCKLITMSEDARFNGHIIPRAADRGALSGVSPLMNQLALHKIFPVPESLPNEDTWMELAILYMNGWKIVHSSIIGCNWRVHGGNSINMMMPFQDYNKKISIRMQALHLFHTKHKNELSPAGEEELRGKIACERSRAAGDIFGVLKSPVPLIERLRALSITNAFMYSLRRRFFGLLSGW